MKVIKTILGLIGGIKNGYLKGFAIIASVTIFLVALTILFNLLMSLWFKVGMAHPDISQMRANFIITKQELIEAKDNIAFKDSLIGEQDKKIENDSLNFASSLIEMQEVIKDLSNKNKAHTAKILKYQTDMKVCYVWEKEGRVLRKEWVLKEFDCSISPK